MYQASAHIPLSSDTFLMKLHKGFINLVLTFLYPVIDGYQPSAHIPLSSDTWVSN